MRFIPLMLKLLMLIALAVGSLEMYSAYRGQSIQHDHIFDWKSKVEFAGMMILPFAMLILWMVIPFRRR